MGPRSRDLLARLTDADLVGGRLPVRHQPDGRRSRASPVRATRMTYVGELGWELLVPVDARRRGVRRADRRRARTSGVGDAGYYAIESLRLEKGYRAFGRELTPDYTPVEAGLVFATALKGDKDFLGREAARGAGEPAGRGRPAPPAGVVRRSTTPTPMLWGGELAAPRRRPGRPGDQRRLGRDGRRLRRAGLPALRRAGHARTWLAAGGFEVDVAGERFGVRLSMKAPFGLTQACGATAPMPVNSTSTTLCPGSVVTSRVTVRVSAAASNRRGRRSTRPSPGPPPRRSTCRRSGRAPRAGRPPRPGPGSR